MIRICRLVNRNFTNFQLKPLHSCSWILSKEFSENNALLVNNISKIMHADHSKVIRGYAVDVKDSKTTPINVEPIKLTNKEKIKKALKEYGSTVIVFHITISLISLQICYLLISSGIDFSSITEWLGFDTETFSKKIASGASTFVVAYAVHKVFAPLRISLTLATTPLIVRFLRTKGYLKK